MKGVSGLDSGGGNLVGPSKKELRRGINTLNPRGHKLPEEGIGQY